MIPATDNLKYYEELGEASSSQQRPEPKEREYYNTSKHDRNSAVASAFRNCGYAIRETRVYFIVHYSTASGMIINHRPYYSYDGKNNAGVNHGCGADAFCAAGIRPVDPCSNCRAGCFLDFANPIPGLSFSGGSGAIAGKAYGDAGRDIVKNIAGKGFKIYEAYSLGSCLDGCKSVCPKNRCE